MKSDFPQAPGIEATLRSPFYDRVRGIPRLIENTIRRVIMKSNIGRTMLVISFLAVFVFSMVPMVQAQTDPEFDGEKIRQTCSNGKAAGAWGFATTGVMLVPGPGRPVPVPVANVTTFTADRAGDLIGSQTRNIGGVVTDETIKGTLSVNSDCTGRIIAHAFDPSSMAPIYTSTLAIVFDDNRRQFQGVVTGTVDPNGKPLPSVLSAEGERVVANDEEHGCTLATLKGQFGAAINGTVIGFGALAASGLTNFDGAGHFSIDATTDVAGMVFPAPSTGMYTVNENCTGRASDSNGDSISFVLVGDRGNEEIMAIETSPSLILHAGVVATVRAKKQ